jgi:hypothetical protein
MVISLTALHINVEIIYCIYLKLFSTFTLHKTINYFIETQIIKLFRIVVTGNMDI